MLRGLRSSLPILPRLLAAALLLAALLAGGRALGQAAPAATWPTGDTAPTDQPLIGQQMGTDLTLNQGVNAIDAENQSIDHYGLGAQAEGGAETNFFGTETNQVTAGYASYSGSGALIKRNDRTQYYGLYRLQYNMYPQYPNVNNFGNFLFVHLDHAFTEHLGLTLDGTAARFLSINQYLPQNLGIGGVGVVVPTLQTQLLENSYEITNAAFSLRLRYLMSARLTLSATGIGAYFLMVPSYRGNAVGLFSERFTTAGGDVRLDYQWTPRDVIGADLTTVFIYGFHPTGHDTAETLQAAYQRQITPTLTVRGAAGPLFIQSSSSLYGNVNDISYAANASLTRQEKQNQFTLAYTRAFVVSFLTPAITANEINFNAYVPFGNHWVLTSNALYTRETIGAATVNGVAQSGTSGSGSIYGGSARIGYLLGTRAELYGIYNRISENLSFGLPQPYNFSQNKFGAGIRFNLGNPITRGGVQ